MLKRAQPAGFRALAAGSLLAAVCVASWIFAAIPAPAAQISIVNGSTTSISKWPWQVAIADGQKKGQKRSPRSRFFCGGSLVTPELVVTAGHCVADLKPGQVRKLEIISGRTRLNDESTGTVTGVLKSIMPLNSNGKRKYGDRYGGAVWDVALLRLATPIHGPTIKIAGSDEAASWAPGQIVKTTGWGVTGSDNQKASSVLRLASQVMLPDRVCRQYNGKQYDVKTMNCIGGPAVNTTTCFGDSGGPLVAPVGDEYRLVGLTSFGDPYCSPNLPSVDSRIAGDAMRRWVRDTALAISGVDVVGSGGVPATPRAWCRVPRLDGLTVQKAKTELSRQGCRLGRVSRTYAFSNKDVNRVIGSSFIRGWLAPIGSRVQVWVGR